MPDSIGQRIAQARRELAVRENEDISQSDIARRLKVRQATVNRWETDTKSPTDDNLLALAKLLGVTPGWLKFGQEPKYPTLEPTSVAKNSRHA